jgi:hypothetical protein
VFAGSGGTWSQQARLTTLAHGAAGDDFSYSMAIAGSTVVGAPGNNSATGAAYVFVNL